MSGTQNNAANDWIHLSDKELEATYLTACAEGIQWLLGSNRIENDQLTIEGWAITRRGRPEDARFLLNGTRFENVSYPRSSPDVGEFFWNIPAAQSSRFVCKTTIDAASSFPDGFARLEFADGSDPGHILRRAWYLSNPNDELPLPEGPQIRRVIGVPSTANYLLGGAAIYKRVEHYLKEHFSKTFTDFPEILDWACGCGRIARNFRWNKNVRVRGVDYDGQNIAWCREHLPHAQFLQTALVPPLPFPDETFDLIIAVSVLNTLSAEHQSLWLRELKRVAKRDAVILVSTPGLCQIGLAHPPARLLRDIASAGFLITSRSGDLDDVMPEQTHYFCGIHSRDYLQTHYGKYFTIIDAVDAIAANDDLIVMKNDKADDTRHFDFTPPAESMPAERSTPVTPANPFSVPLRDYDINPFIHPTMAKSGYRGHLIDVNGKDYVDFGAAWGTNVLGYGYRKVARAAASQAKRFNNIGLPYPQFHELMGLIRKIIPSAEEVRYGKNGSDACAGAVRLIRHLTGREKILYRGYHGFHDWYFASTECPGIPVALKSTVMAQPELTPTAIDSVFKQYPNQIAGLIVNPLTGPIPTSDEMREVMAVIHRHGGLVIFDEMLSGFRVALGGMQEVWGVKPDISCFGKGIANGLPLSVLCGKAEYIRRLPETCYGMTFEGEAVSIAAAYATIKEIIDRNVIAAFYEKGRRIRADYQRIAAANDISTKLVGYEPCMHLEFHDHGKIPARQLLWLMIQELVRRNIFTCGAFILCYSHDRRDLRKLEKALESAMQVLRTAVDRGTTQGLLDDRIRERMDDIQSPAKWRQA